MKCVKWLLSFFISLFLLICSSPVISLAVFADDLPDEPEPLEVSEDTSIEDYANEESGNWWDDLSADETPEEYEDALGTPYDWPEWLGEEPEDLGPMALEPEPEIESTDQLTRIEFHLAVISGGVILAVCSLFTWFMIIKPIKSFIVF